MGKRRRSSGDHHKTKFPSSSDDMPCPSEAELLSRQGKKLKLENELGSAELKPLSPGMDVSDSTVKLLNLQSSLMHQNCNIGRSVVLKRSRHFYGHQYSRRNSGSHANASASHGKTAPLHDERLTFKLSSQTGSEIGCHAENMVKAFTGPDRVRFSSLVMDAVSSETVKMVCGICQKPLRRKPYFLGNALGAGELAVVAILVCGHVYHAECLEEKTKIEDMRDPPCTLCLGSLLEVDALRGQE